mgnify:CR=1 FL=1
MKVKKQKKYYFSLLRVGSSSEEIAKAAISAGADILANEIRKNLTANLNDPESASRRGGVLFKNYYNKTSGSLLKALGITPIRQDKKVNNNSGVLVTVYYQSTTGTLSSLTINASVSNQFIMFKNSQFAIQSSGRNISLAGNNVSSISQGALNCQVAYCSYSSAEVQVILI